MIKRLFLIGAAIAAPLFSVSAQANLIFSGGSGNPLTMTLLAPVEYTINSTPQTGLPSFVFVGTGNKFYDITKFTGSINFSVNGLGAFVLTYIGSGNPGGMLAEDDMYLFSDTQPLTLGDVIRLNAGAITSTGIFSAAPPETRAYETFIMDDAGEGRSTFGVSVPSVVPEPATFALMGMGLLTLIAVRARISKERRRT